MLEKISEQLNALAIDVATIKQDVKRNTDDVAEHIRRTDILEAKTHRILHALIFIGGAASVHFGPSILSLIRIVI